MDFLSGVGNGSVGPGQQAADGVGRQRAPCLGHPPPGGGEVLSPRNRYERSLPPAECLTDEKEKQHSGSFLRASAAVTCCGPVFPLKMPRFRPYLLSPASLPASAHKRKPTGRPLTAH